MAAAATETKKQIKILSWNLLAEVWLNPEWFKGVEQKYMQLPRRLQTIVETIKERKDCDILLFQEIDENMFPFLCKELKTLEFDLMPISQNKPTSAKDKNGKTIANGTAVAIRSQTWSKSNLTVHAQLMCDMGATVIKLSTGEKIVNVHLDRGTDGDKQTESLQKYLDDNKGKTAIIGDFNRTPEEMKTWVAQLKGQLCTPDGSLCFSLGQTNFLQLDHGVGIGGLVVKEFPEAATFVSWRKFFACIRQEWGPINVMNTALYRVGSDHLPVQFIIE